MNTDLPALPEPAPLMDRLRSRREFFSVDPGRWYMSSSPDRDCAEAAEAIAAKDAEIARLRAALAAQQPAAVPAGWREAVQRLVTGFEHVSGIARLWEPDYSSGADRAKWARATEACADVARLLAAAPSSPQQKGDAA